MGILAKVRASGVWSGTVVMAHGADFGAGAEPFFGIVIGGVAVDFEQDAGGKLG